MSLKNDLENDVKLGKETSKEKAERKGLEMKKETFEETLNEFFVKLRERDDKFMTENFDMIGLSEWDLSFGRKYVKIIRSNSVYAFVDMNNGDILMPAGWKAPAKHARGNIFSDDPLAGTDIYGVNYLR